ncbi:MAG: DUF721 domain-containing protein [Gammaproteobacteria bacterium]|nr:DUF721 domain-containing protein [Gammaproteobacteria bacterium]
MNGKFKPLKNYLQIHGEFATIQARMQQNQASLRLVKELLPAPLNDHCLSLVTKPRQFVLYTDSSAWASRLRYFSRELVTRLRNKQIDINKISVKVMVDNRRTVAKLRVREARLLSTKNADLLSRVADHTPDPDLQAAFRRLSSHHKNRK